MSKKILHIANDEKFIESANWMFEKAFPEQNEFLIIVPSRLYKVKYIKMRDNFSFIYSNEISIKSFIKIFEIYDIIILHNLDFFKAKSVIQAKSTTKFLWLFWGAEIYDNPKLFDNQFIGSRTKKAFSKQIFYSQVKNILRPLAYQILHKTKDRFLIILKAAKKIKYFGVLYKEEYDFMIKQDVLSQDSKFIKTTYYPIEFIFDKSENLITNGDNILIGNSSSMTNNHLEAFNLISKLDIQRREIIVPLSYGNKKYRDKIISLGNEIFQHNFKAKTDFMSLDDYNRMLQSCGIVIMNHYRQQAVGTVLGMLNMGAKLFLNEKNTLYSYLKRIGIIVFSIEKDLSSKESLLPLNKDQINSNRAILKEEIGVDNLIKELQEDFHNIINGY